MKYVDKKPFEDLVREHGGELAMAILQDVIAVLESDSVVEDCAVEFIHHKMNTPPRRTNARGETLCPVCARERF